MENEELKQRLIELQIAGDISAQEQIITNYTEAISYIADFLVRNGVTIRERGEWKLGKSGCMYFCTHCANFAHPREKDEWCFCPHCGADMRGVKI